MAFTGENEICMGMVFKAMTADWPSGETWLVVDRLFKRYKPNDVMKEIELNRKLVELKLKDNESPSSLFTQIAGIENWYSGKLSNDKVMPALIQALPKECYKVTASTFCLEKMKNNQTDYELDDLEEQLMMLWRSLGGSNLISESEKKKKNNETEVVLGHFAGICYKYNKTGHKAKDRTEKRNGFTGNCLLCEKTGHKKADCWEEEKNSNKRTKNWKSNKQDSRNDKNDQSDKGGKNGKEVSGRMAEVMLALILPDNQNLLTDMNVFVADTGATTHSTPHITGLTEIQNCESGDDIVVGNGETITATNIGSIRGMKCDKNGCELNRVKLTEVTYVENGVYNLFS